jgi:Icc protein
LRGPHITAPRQIVRGLWNIVLLDSTVPRKNGGNFRAGELRFLKKSLRAYPHHHALVSFHHNPIKTGSKWLDTMTIKNAKKFLKIVDKSSKVKAVVFGHVHQAIAQKRKGVLYAASPATCIQFKPRSVKFKLDSKQPGYQWIFLGDDGQVRTLVRRVKSPQFRPDMKSRGY